jgi:haloalkane dehalogenase
VYEAVAAYADWLATAPFPKLFFKVEPGAILTSDELVGSVRSWPNLTEVAVKGIHFVQEDSPDEIGRAIAEWIQQG